MRPAEVPFSVQLLKMQEPCPPFHMKASNGLKAKHALPQQRQQCWGLWVGCSPGLLVALHLGQLAGHSRNRMLGRTGPCWPHLASGPSQCASRPCRNLCSLAMEEGFTSQKWLRRGGGLPILGNAVEHGTPSPPRHHKGRRNVLDIRGHHCIEVALKLTPLGEQMGLLPPPHRLSLLSSSPVAASV